MAVRSARTEPPNAATVIKGSGGITMKTNINRRSFLKGAAMTGAAALAAWAWPAARPRRKASRLRKPAARVRHLRCDGSVHPVVLSPPTQWTSRRSSRRLRRCGRRGHGPGRHLRRRAALEEGAECDLPREGRRVPPALPPDHGHQFQNRQRAGRGVLRRATRRILRQVVADGRGRGNYQPAQAHGVPLRRGLRLVPGEVPQLHGARRPADGWGDRSRLRSHSEHLHRRFGRARRPPLPTT